MLDYYDIMQVQERERRLSIPNTHRLWDDVSLDKSATHDELSSIIRPSVSQSKTVGVEPSVEEKHKAVQTMVTKLNHYILQPVKVGGGDNGHTKQDKSREWIAKASSHRGYVFSIIMCRS